eukprot:CAMPEP_0184985292 /NCGR_PEP_ID=MMETSP1098-20130426/14038_1 /TAXON_ID=89044 /ORGANISM="Spumella elongata, Strain CCAP 955/1" /LENGTH=821 /DNA_ID=CAMNT_0027509371 /DNA_START=100 /DNA_END=2565 /DNA_ORIENTATION=+
MSTLLRDRELHPFPMRLTIENALEDSFVAGNACKFDNPLPPSVSSTIAIAMSCDGQTFATTHGDHTVKVFDFISGEQIRMFSGHPRTPWTIKYHPTDPNIIASGCLGYEVRVWHIERNVCLNLNTYSQTIISLAFHPNGYFIAVACGMSIQLWDWQNSTGEIEGTFPIVPTKPNTTGMLPETSLSGTKESANGETEGNQEVSEPENPINWRGITHTRNIRAVLFHPSGDYIFAVAPDSPKQAVEELAHCRLYACEFSALLNVDTVPLWGSPSTHTNSSTSTSTSSASNKNDNTPINTATTEMNRSYEEDQLEDLVVLEDPIFPLKLSSCRVLIPQIHLYSDGGIDVSKDGRYLITCARVSVPPAVTNDLFSQRSTSILSPSTPSHPPMAAYKPVTGRSSQGPGEIPLPPLFSAHQRGTERPLNVPVTSSRSPLPPPPPVASDSSGLRATSPGVLSFASLRSTMSAFTQRAGLSSLGGGGGLSSSGSSGSDFRSVPSSTPSGQNSTHHSPLPATAAMVSAPVTPGANVTSGAYTPPAPPAGHEPSPVTHTLTSPQGDTNTDSAMNAMNPPHTPTQQPSLQGQITPNGENHQLGGLLGQMSLSPSRQRDIDGTPKVIDMVTKRSGHSNQNSAENTPYKTVYDNQAQHTPERGSNATDNADNREMYASFKGYVREAQTRKIQQCHMHKMMSRAGAGQMRGWRTEDHLCVFELNFTSQGIISKPTLLNSKRMPGGLMKAVTSAKLSGTCRYALIGYGVRVSGQVPDHPRRHAACEVVSVHEEHMPSVTVMSDFEDEVNIAQFHPMPGHGVVYGTKRGKIRTFGKA